MNPPDREQLALHAAPPPLRPWAPCVLLRRVAAAEPPQPLAARVHANTFACLNVVAQGEVHCDGRAQPARFLAGPAARPRDTRVTGALASASLVLAPWVLEPWLGLRPDSMVDALVDVDGVRAARLDPLCAALARACREPAALEAVWSLLGDGIAACPAPELALHVLRAEGVAAAAAALGCSERQYRRRFQRHLGLGPAAWQRVRRWEETLQELLAPGAPSPLADLAAGHGYADQSHLARDTQDFVRASPGALRTAGDWPLAAARVRILQDTPPGAA
jgi:AraC-like DNA-binding protein